MDLERAPATRTTLPLAYGQVRALAPDLAALLAAGRQVVLELGPPSAPDLGLVAVLADLALHARRSGGALVVRGDGELVALLRLVGLEAVLGSVEVEVHRQPELREDLRPEEVVDVGDAPG